MFVPEFVQCHKLTYIQDKIPANQVYVGLRKRRMFQDIPSQVVSLRAGHPLHKGLGPRVFFSGSPQW